MSICANEKSKIIELCPEKTHQIQDAYKEICESLNIFWKRFHTEAYDNNDNMIVDVNKLLNFLKEII